ncbi:hypothetical protein A6R68_07943 [Neotoma lepida]|uniref:Uncharacterized protein n=1 Tax=Neotoma lepida TaxID=56216 RepID=A0A1A6GCP2_NEOLE|nr:hypothetical protein A6R68_07943 [Neotoma lepida]
MACLAHIQQPPGAQEHGGQHVTSQHEASEPKASWNDAFLRHYQPRRGHSGAQDHTRTMETEKASSRLALREINLPDRAQLKQRRRDEDTTTNASCSGLCWSSLHSYPQPPHTKCHPRVFRGPHFEDQHILREDIVAGASETVRTGLRQEWPTSLASAPAHCDLPGCTQAFVTVTLGRFVSQGDI